MKAEILALLAGLAVGSSALAQTDSQQKRTEQQPDTPAAQEAGSQAGNKDQGTAAQPDGAAKQNATGQKDLNESKK